MHRSFFILAALAVLAIAAPAQTSREAVTGTVIDSLGALIAGGNVTVIGTETGARRATISNEAGIYRFEAVDLAVYKIKVTHPGFKAFLATEILVQANRTDVIDARLEVGSEDIAVQVTAEAEAMTVRDSPLRGGNFLPQQVRELPLIGLNPISLAHTLPGVVQPSGSFVQTVDEPTGFFVNGQRTRGNNFLLDGTENNAIAFTGVALPFHIAGTPADVQGFFARAGPVIGPATSSDYGEPKVLHLKNRESGTPPVPDSSGAWC